MLAYRYVIQSTNLAYGYVKQSNNLAYGNVKQSNNLAYGYVIQSNSWPCDSACLVLLKGGLSWCGLIINNVLGIINPVDFIISWDLIFDKVYFWN